MQLCLEVFGGIQIGCIQCLGLISNNVMMKLPEFIIVGTMKSGTSTLGFHLNQHKEIYMPDKEIHFFDGIGGYKDRWEKGIDWYQEQFDNANKNQKVGEKTPTYCYVKEVPGRIKEVLPEVKLIWIFRNPVDRAYSNYWHAVRNGGEKESFEYAVKHEAERVKKNIWKGYLKRSNYIEQVDRYLSFFEPDNMLFLTFEELKSDLAGTLKKACEFLQVEFQPSMCETKEIKNKTYLPRFPAIRYYFAEQFGSRSILSKIERKINVKKESYPKMDPDLRNKLLEKFRKSNEKLADVTGLNLDHWNK